jgi:cation diffusion facilitator family transporter
MVAELYIGYQTGSKALIMDGWHMLSHVLVLSLAWAAYYYLKQTEPKVTNTKRQRVISLAGFASAIVMLVVTSDVIYEAVERYSVHVVEVSNEAIAIACTGFVVNGLSAFLLHREEEKRDVNLYAAYLHVLSDVVLSLLAIVSLLIVKYTGYYAVDTYIAFIGAAVLVKWSYELIRKSWKELMH